MFSYNFSILKLIKQNRNPHVIVGNALTYVRALLKPMENLRAELLTFIDDTREKEKWTWQIASMEQLLNDKYAVTIRNIRIETLNATKIVPLGDRFSGESYLGSRTSTSGFLIPTKEEAEEAVGIGDNFVVYADTATIAAHESAMRRTIEYYMFSGLRYQIRNLNDVIPNSDYNTETTLTP